MAETLRNCPESGKSRRNCGSGIARRSFSFATCTLALALLASLAGDSPAEAKSLENSVRAWDRSGLKTLRPPAPGRKRFARPRATQPAARAADVAWFWNEVSPARTAGRATRLETALDLLRERRRTHGPLYGTATLDRIGRSWHAHARTASERRNLSEALILAVIAVESAGQPRARSPKGAQGLMQLIPATARRFAVADAYDPAENIAGGAAYLDWLIDRFGGDAILALAGYNAGEGAVDRHRGVPPYAETRAYVVRVLDALVAAEALCTTPPTHPRKPCGWRTGTGS